MLNRIALAVEILDVVGTAILGVIWAVTQDGWYEPYTVLCGAAVPVFDIIRRVVGHFSNRKLLEYITSEGDGIYTEKDEEVVNVKLFGERFSQLLEKNRGYILAQFVSLSQLTDLESWKRASVDGTLKRFAKLCDARNSVMASPDAVGIMGSMSKIKRFVLSMPKGMSEEDLKQLTAHREWSELTTKLAQTGPRTDAEVEKWLKLSRDFLESCLVANDAKDRKMKESVRKWITENQ